jgi:hypothetical protein
VSWAVRRSNVPRSVGRRVPAPPYGGRVIDPNRPGAAAVVLLAGLLLAGCGGAAPTLPTTAVPTSVPGTTIPDGAAPGSGAPDGGEAGSGRPGSGGAGSGQPGSGGAGSGQPGSDGAGSGGAGAGEPGSGTPGTRGPGTETAPGMPAPSPTQVSLPWPAENAADAAALQAAVDDGAQPWLLDPAEVSLSYAAAAHGWHDAVARTGAGGTTVDVEGPAGERITLTLAQPGRTGPGGIWVVTADNAG